MLPSGHVRRKALLEQLHRGLDPQSRLTLVHGGPGFGKTTLVADYSGWAGLPAVWYNLNETDADLVVFAAHLLEGLKARFPDLSERPLELIRAASTSERLVAAAMGLLCEELGSRGAFLLVLDDFQAIESSGPVSAAVQSLVQDFPEDGQLLIISRTQPGLKLPKLRIRQQLTELGPGELKFTRDELVRLFREQAGRELDDQALDAVARHSEGWIASVVLALKAGLPLEHSLLTEQIEDYFYQEVYEHQIPELRTFLLEAAHLPQIDGPLCEEVLELEEARKHMAMVWERNLFVALASNSDGQLAYQLHPLFRSFLLERARTELDADRLRRIHRQLADRLLQEAPAQALEHYLAAGEAALAVERLDDLGWQLLRSQRFATVGQILSILPESLRDLSAPAQLLAGEVARATGDFDLALEHFARAQHLAEAAGDRRRTGLALAFKSAVLAARSHATRAEVANQALSVLPDDEAFGRAMAHNVLGVEDLFSDRTAAGIEHFEAALEQFRAAGDFAGQARVLHNLGLTQARLGRFSQASAYYSDSIRLSERAGRWALPMTYNNLALVSASQGQLDAGLEAATRGLELARQLEARREEVFLLWTLGDLHLKRGELREALDYFEQARDAARQLGDHSQEALAIAGLASVEVAERRPERALVMIRQAIELRGFREGDPTLGDLVYPLAEAQLAAGKLDEAAAALEPALEYLERVDFRYRLAQNLFLLACARGEDGEPLRARARDIATEMGYEYLLAQDLALDGGAASRTTALETRIAARPAIAIWTFGAFRVEVDGKEIPQREWRGYKTRLILAYLLANRRGATKEELSELFYSDQDTTRSAIHVLISRLRQALEPELDKVQNSRFIRFVGGRYCFNFDLAYWWDARDFDYHLGRIRDASLSSGERTLAARSAIDLYGGPYLSEFQSESWCQVDAEHYRRKVEQAFESAIDEAERKSDFELALSLAERYLAVDPTSELAHCHKIRALARQGRRDAALRHFQTMEQILDRELGLKPGPDTLALHKRILAGQT